jgi:ATP:ADP antiporter, AAA family
MLGHAFFSGLGIALSFTAINVLLLEKHGSEHLPVIYAISALVLMAGGFIYSKLEHAISPSKLFLGVLVFSTIWAFFTRLYATETQSVNLLIGVYSSYFLIYQLNNLQFWGAAALLYDVRQSKRLFGLLAAGESIAKILGYAITPLFITLFSLEDLMILAGVAFLVSSILLYGLTKKEKENLVVDHHHLERKTEKKQYKIIGAFKFLNSLRSDKFTRNVALFAMLSTLVYYSIHYAFLSEVEEEFANLEDLAFFFGLFFSIAKALNLIIKSLLSGRMLNLVGIRLLIVLLPLTLTLINLIGITGFFTLSNPVKFFLWIFGFNMLADEIMRSSLHKPSYLTLFQPLQKNKRLEGHTIAKGIMEPIGMGIAGITILLLEKYHLFNAQNFILYLLVFALLWLFSSFFVSKVYREMLAKVLKSRLLSRQNISFSKEELTLLKEEKLKSHDDFEKLYAIKLLQGHIADDDYEMAIVDLLKSKNESILLETLQLIENSGSLNIKNSLKDLLFSHKQEIGKKAIYCYCAQLEEDSVDELMPYFETVNDDWKEGIIGGILKYSGIYGATVAGDALLQWTRSDNPELRLRVARIIGDIGKKEYYHPLIKLIEDENPDVVKEAIIAAGKVGNTKLINQIVQKSGEKHLFNYCMRALEKMGPSAIPWIETALTDQNDIRKIKKLIRIASKLPSEATNKFLVSLLDSEAFVIRNEALYSLHLLQFRANQYAEKLLVEMQLEKEIGTFKSLIKIIDENPKNYDLPIAESLLHEVRLIQIRVLYLLSFVYDRSTLEKVIDSMKTGSHAYQSNACELLENLLKRQHAHNLVPIIEFNTYAVAEESQRVLEHQNCVSEALWKVEAGMISDWLVALSIRCYRLSKQGIRTFPDHILQAARSQAVKQELSLTK